MNYIVCLGCGNEDVYLRGPDSLDWCDECGIVEGNTTTIRVEHED